MNYLTNGNAKSCSIDGWTIKPEKLIRTYRQVVPTNNSSYCGFESVDTNVSASMTQTINITHRNHILQTARATASVFVDNGDITRLTGESRITAHYLFLDKHQNEIKNQGKKSSFIVL